jgi:hypothetical protein
MTEKQKVYLLARADIDNYYRMAEVVVDKALTSWVDYYFR